MARHLNLAAAFAAAFLLSLPAFAQFNHGTFNGTQVDFVDVTETTQSAGDPAQLWEAPTLGGTGDQLQFFPTAFTAACNPGLASDLASSLLTTDIEAQPGVHIEIVSLVESGDVVLINSPFPGASSTNGSISMSGTVTVTETTSGPITPVVIPFSGAFTPSDTFALPVNFGSSSWSGSMSVDVASVVPLATKATLALDNTLTANCSPSGFGTVQKKSVSGPAVSLLVNPLECSLDLDKTCCVTQPVLPDLDACGEDDDIVKLTMEFTGDKCHNSSNDQGRAFRCWGRRRVKGPASITILRHASEITAMPSSGINKGDEVMFTSSTGTLFDKLKLKVSGAWYRRQYLKIDTSCDRAIQCGDKFGAFTVTGIETVVNGVIDCNAPPPPPECAPDGDPPGTLCDAKLVDMVFEYNGQDCQDPLPNPQNGEASCDGDATGATNVGVIYTGKFPWKQTIIPSSGINDGDLIRVSATWWGGLFPNQEYKIVDGSGVRQRIDLHVSCSQPLALGDEFGSLKLVEFTTKSGFSAALGTGNPGPFDACEVPLAPPGPHCTSDLKELTLVYIDDFLGEGCTVSNPQSGFAHCTGVDAPGDPVSVSVTPSSVEVDPDDMIEFGDLITINNVTDGADLPGLVQVDTTGAGGSQWVQIKTSCYKPLSLGDRFGAWVVFGMDREDDGPISLGGNVQYQFKVTNPSLTDTVENVAIDDSELGNIVSGETLLPEEMKTFVQNATLFGTTTNVATATGDVNGDICDPGMDQVTVDVIAPAPGSFYCSEPITGVTLIWDGAQNVDVRAYQGSGKATLVDEYDDLAPGDAIELEDLIFGLTLEIYEAAMPPFSGAYLGDSVFDLWCTDHSMNGLEDCGKNNGNLGANKPWLINDWLLEGMTDSDETLACTPGLVPNPPACGFGPELIVLMPGLMWWHRRRLRKDA